MRISDWSSDVCSSDLLNLCDDRYRFMVTFGAALINGQTCVLPPNHAERVLAQVRDACADQVCVGAGAEPGDERSLRFPPYRSEDRRVGKKCGSTWRSLWSPYIEKKNYKETTRV